MVVNDTFRFVTILVAVFSLLCGKVFAQEKLVVSEENLPVVIEQKTNDGNLAQPLKEADSPDIKNSTLLDDSKNDLAKILTGQTITSLMFNDMENGNIDKAINGFKTGQIYTPDEDENKDGASSGSQITLSDEEKRRAAEQEIQESEKSYLHLASIIYFSSKSWIVWINDKKITSEVNNSQNELYIQSIKKDQVSVLWKLSLSKWKVISGLSEEMAPKTNSDNMIEVRFKLRPNQTFILSSNAIVEGNGALVALLKKKEDIKKLAPSNPTPSAPQGESDFSSAFSNE